MLRKFLPFLCCNRNRTKIDLERESVCAADDCDAPHLKNLTFDKSTSLLDVVLYIIKIDYLGFIYGNEATWVVKGKDNVPLAVLAQWRKPRFLVDPSLPFTQYIESKIYIEYLAHIDPDIVFERLQNMSETAKRSYLRPLFRDCLPY